MGLPKVGQSVRYNGERYTVQAVSYWTTRIRPEWTPYGFHDRIVRHTDLEGAWQ